MRNYRVGIGFFAVVMAIGLAAFTVFSTPHSSATSISVVNNSSGEIRHLYLSPANSDNWGSDLLNETSITSGGSFTIADASCNEASIKVVAENQDGCFYYKTVSCGVASTWTITNDSTPDCGY